MQLVYVGQMLSTQKERIDLNTDVDNAPALLTAVDAHIHTIETLSDAELIRNNRVLLRSMLLNLLPEMVRTLSFDQISLIINKRIKFIDLENVDTYDPRPSINQALDTFILKCQIMKYSNSLFPAQRV
jgi:hypothetical protein